jgi:hypothetical protein
MSVGRYALVGTAGLIGGLALGILATVAFLAEVGEREAARAVEEQGKGVGNPHEDR